MIDNNTSSEWWRWVWSILIIPIIALFTNKADKSEVKEAHNEVDQMRKELEHITDRVDKIYDHLINGSKGKQE